MTTITTATNRADLSFEIERLRPRAEAEQRLAAAGFKPKDNPWSGSMDRLAACERELRALDQREADGAEGREAEAFAAAVAAYRKLVAQEDELRSNIARIESDMRPMVPLNLRWRKMVDTCSPNYRAYLIKAIAPSDSTSRLKPGVDFSFPPNWYFNDDEVAQMRGYIALAGELSTIRSQISARESERSALCLRYPVLRELA